MSTGTRVTLDEANLMAVALASTLYPACERVEIAGSIRRGRSSAGDIELVAIPKVETVPDGMWGDRRINRLGERLDECVAAGVLARHPTDPKRGDRYSKVWEPSLGIQVDIFSATVDTWGLIYLIRTGPADYSREFVTDLRKRGLHAAGGALHRGGLGCRLADDGKTALCDLVPTPEEQDVYSAAGWPFIPPDLRT